MLLNRNHVLSSLYLNSGVLSPLLFARSSCYVHSDVLNAPVGGGM